MIIAIMLGNTPELLSQAFLTRDFPEYAYKVKLRYQQAFFDEMPEENVSAGVYNLSASIPFNHTLSGFVNVPFMADYTVASDKNVRMGNMEFGLDLLKPKWDYQSHVFSFSFVIPFSTQNIYNRENVNGDLTSLTEKAFITDYPKRHWYMQGAWTASFFYSYHYTKKFFQLMFGFGNGLIARKADQGQSSSVVIFLHPSIRTTFQVSRFYFSGELVNAFYYYSENYNDESFEVKGNFVSTLGITYKFNRIEAGVFYQLNLRDELSKLAQNILGVQCIFRLPKQEKYLKTKTK